MQPVAAVAMDPNALWAKMAQHKFFQQVKQEDGLVLVTSLAQLFASHMAEAAAGGSGPATGSASSAGDGGRALAEVPGKDATKDDEATMHVDAEAAKKRAIQELAAQKDCDELNEAKNKRQR